MPNSTPWRLTPVFSSKSFYTFSSYIYVCEPFWVNFCLECQVVVPAPFVEKTIPFSLNLLDTFVGNQLTINASLFLGSQLYSIWHLYARTTLSWLLRLIVSLKLGYVILLSLCFFLKVVLAILSQLYLRMSFRMSLSTYETKQNS